MYNLNEAEGLPDNCLRFRVPSMLSSFSTCLLYFFASSVKEEVRTVADLDEEVAWVSPDLPEDDVAVLVEDALTASNSRSSLFNCSSNCSRGRALAVFP
jgi:hypothetical protein